MSKDACASGSAHLTSTAAPAASVAFLLDVHYNIHIPAFEELYRTFAHIFKVCGVRSDDVNDAENLLLSGSVAVVVVVIVIVVVVSMADRVGVGVCVVVVMVVTGVFVLVSVCVAMIVVMIMAAVTVVMLVLVRMSLCVCRALILQPKLRHCVANYSSERTEFLQRIAHTILCISRKG